MLIERPLHNKTYTNVHNYVYDPIGKNVQDDFNFDLKYSYKSIIFIITS
jgi:hypothetical protein